MFHAKDDIPEVRKEVFTLLGVRNDLRFFAAIRKTSMLFWIMYYREIRLMKITTTPLMNFMTFWFAGYSETIYTKMKNIK